MLILIVVFICLSLDMAALPTIRLPSHDSAAVSLRFEHVNKCFQIYKFSPYVYTCDLWEFMSAVAPPLLIVMHQLYNVPCKVQLSLKCLFVKVEIDDNGCSHTMNNAIITNERQARIFNDADSREYIDMAMERFDKFIDEWSEHGSGGYWTTLLRSPTMCP